MTSTLHPEQLLLSTPHSVFFVFPYFCEASSANKRITGLISSGSNFPLLPSKLDTFSKRPPSKAPPQLTLGIPPRFSRRRSGQRKKNEKNDEKNDEKILHGMIG